MVLFAPKPMIIFICLVLLWHEELSTVLPHERLLLLDLLESNLSDALL